MPTVLRQSGFQFKIYPNDHAPAHIHVRYAEKRARVSLDPIEVMNNWGLNPRELSQMLEIVREHQSELLAEWSKYHE